MNLHTLIIYSYFTPCMAVSVTLTTILCTYTTVVTTICNMELCITEDHS